MLLDCIGKELGTRERMGAQKMDCTSCEVVCHGVMGPGWWQDQKSNSRIATGNDCMCCKIYGGYWVAAKHCFTRQVCIMGVSILCAQIHFPSCNSPYVQQNLMQGVVPHDPPAPDIRCDRNSALIWLTRFIAFHYLWSVWLNHWFSSCLAAWDLPDQTTLGLVVVSSNRFATSRWSFTHKRWWAMILLLHSLVSVVIVIVIHHNWYAGCTDRPSLTINAFVTFVCFCWATAGSGTSSVCPPFAYWPLCCPRGCEPNTWTDVRWICQRRDRSNHVLSGMLVFQRQGSTHYAQQSQLS